MPRGPEEDPRGSRCEDFAEVGSVVVAAGRPRGPRRGHAPGRGAAQRHRLGARHLRRHPGGGHDPGRRVGPGRDGGVHARRRDQLHHGDRPGPHRCRGGPIRPGPGVPTVMPGGEDARPTGPAATTGSGASGFLARPREREPSGSGDAGAEMTGADSTSPRRTLRRSVDHTEARYAPARRPSIGGSGAIGPTSLGPSLSAAISAVANWFDSLLVAIRRVVRGQGPVQRTIRVICVRLIWPASSLWRSDGGACLILT